MAVVSSPKARVPIAPAADVNTSAAELTRHQVYYHRFMLGVKWFGLHIAVAIVLLTLWFCTPAGLGWGLFAAIAIAVIGVYAMTHGLNHSSERPWPPEHYNQ